MKAALACTTIVVVLGLAVKPSRANERAGELVNSFQVMCTLEPIDYEHLKSKASAMRLPISKDLGTPPDAQGYFAKSTSWVLPLTSGPHEFLAGDSIGPDGRVKSCGIGASDVNGADFKGALVSTMGLGVPLAEIDAPNGMHMIRWATRNEGSELLLAVATSSSQPGCYLILLERSQ